MIFLFRAHHKSVKFLFHSAALELGVKFCTPLTRETFENAAGVKSLIGFVGRRRENTSALPTWLGLSGRNMNNYNVSFFSRARC